MHLAGCALCIIIYIISQHLIRNSHYKTKLCDALAFAHEKGVSHHDVKAANILIDASAGGKFLLADFGASLKP